jgi:hypothetical protein
MLWSTASCTEGQQSIARKQKCQEKEYVNCLLFYTGIGDTVANKFSWCDNSKPAELTNRRGCVLGAFANTITAALHYFTTA